MSMFPGAGANVYRNDEGEPIGWDYPSEPDPGDYEEAWYDYDGEIAGAAWDAAHEEDE